jgi:hypothetical protein
MRENGGHQAQQRDGIGRQPQRDQEAQHKLVERRQRVLVDQREVAAAVLVPLQPAASFLAQDLTHLVLLLLLVVGVGVGRWSLVLVHPCLWRWIALARMRRWRGTE